MASEMNMKALKALADPTRLHIVELLSSCCCGSAAVRENGDVEGRTAGEVCCHITGAEKITSTVSHHLHELEAAGLIRMERRGKTSVCSLRPESFESLGDYLKSLAIGGNENGCY
jgi:ArsR family transcriptional regulator, arsenate/arsenite/antimonite-responsive transcriptional repressor